tara:strand:- start:57 stop:302 length:246 start_codon:yes stop_codon:yes gene_type:complete
MVSEEQNHHKKAGPLSLAAALLIMGGSNMYKSSEGVSETRQMRAEITSMREAVQGMATTVTLLQWRVSNLEGVKDGSKQGT